MQGVGIVVTDENKMTGANFSLRNPDEVATFLELLVESRRKGASARQHHHHSTTTGTHFASTNNSGPVCRADTIQCTSLVSD